MASRALKPFFYKRSIQILCKSALIECPSILECGHLLEEILLPPGSSSSLLANIMRLPLEWDGAGRLDETQRPRSRPTVSDEWLGANLRGDLVLNEKKKSWEEEIDRAHGLCRACSHRHDAPSLRRPAGRR